MKTCLIVDDSAIIRKVARRILESLEFQILEAENGEQAFETCQSELPDAILLDWNMPKMDGYDFLSVLRGLPGGERPKVVFCTLFPNSRLLAQHGTTQARPRLIAINGGR